MRKGVVRIVLVGDRGVGKTSLILSLVSEEFPEDVPARAEEIIIPADVTPERVPTHIVDYSASEQDDDQLALEIKKADVVCVVYALNDSDSLYKVTSRWLPFIRVTMGQGHTKPVVLVGNKVDLVGQSNYEKSFFQAIVPLMRDYAEIETSVECSAKTLRNLSEMFYYAQKAVLHPAAPLFVPDEEALTSKCERALIRIFSICDMDNDGALNDHELHTFQKRCFSDPLEPHHLEEVKTVIRRNVSEGVAQNGITLKGFLFLNSLFIQRGRHETTWAVLRRFGYDDNLELGQSYLRPLIEVPPGCIVELTPVGQEFLQMMFKKYDTDFDGALSPKELSAMFAFSPSIPWDANMCYAVPTNNMDWMTYKGFLCQWAMLLLLDVNKALEYMAHLGFVITESDNQLAAVHVTREKGLDLMKRQTGRNVYRCHVIGSRGSGKTTLCHDFLGRSLQKIASMSDALPSYVMNTVQVYGQEKYLMLQDIEVHNVADVLLPAEVQCDVACLVYDISNPRSFESIAKIYLRYFKDTRVPVLVVANKSDLAEVNQEYILQPEDFCQRYKLSTPQKFTSTGKVNKELFVKVATMAAFPRFQAAWMLFYRHRHLKQLGLLPESNLTWIKAGIGLAVVTAVGLLISRMFKFRR